MDFMPTSSSDLAAWVQAVGSIIAIAVAISVPVYMSRQDRRRLMRERLVRTKSYAYVLLPTVEKMASELVQAEWRLKRSGSHLQLHHIAEDLKAAVKLLDRPIEIHELDEIAHPVLDGFAFTEKLADLIEEHESYLRHGGEVHDPKTGESYPLVEPPDYTPALMQARSRIDAAVRQMRELFA